MLQTHALVMMQQLAGMLRCPVTRQKLTLTIIKETSLVLDGQPVQVVEEGLLIGDGDWVYPIIKGVPRLNPDAFIEYRSFLSEHVPRFDQRFNRLMKDNRHLLEYVVKKNKRTRQSFSKEWQLHDPAKDKTWNAGDEGMMHRFLTETDESIASLQGKIIFDAGCGNGKLNAMLASHGITNIAMDFSNSIEEAYTRNGYAAVHYIQGDVQFPPVAFQFFDIVHCSGVLIHTNNTELSFSCIVPALKPGGKMSIWLYHHRDDAIHNLFNSLRSFTSKWPFWLKFNFYRLTIFPVAWLVKKWKGNPQTAREQMIDLLDWFTPEFRWEHGHTEVASWFYKRGFKNVKITTEDIFGINMIGEQH